MMKPTALLVSHPAFRDVMVKRCLGGHSYAVISGARKCKQAGKYTGRFAQNPIKALERADWLGDVPSIRRVHRLHPTEAEMPPPTRVKVEDPLGSRAITFGIPVKGEVAKLLRRLHQHLAHPSKDELVRNLRLSGATQKVNDAAKSLKCASCAKHKREEAHCAMWGTLMKKLDSTLFMSAT